MAAWEFRDIIGFRLIQPLVLTLWPFSDVYYFYIYKVNHFCGI